MSVKRKKKRYLLKSVALSELATKDLGWLAHTTNNYLPSLNERFHALKVFPASFSGYNWIMNKRRGEENVRSNLKSFRLRVGLIGENAEKFVRHCESTCGSKERTR